MDIETGNIQMNVCSLVDNQNEIDAEVNVEDTLVNSMQNCGIEKQPLTIYIAGLLERLTRDIVYEKVYDVEAGQHILNINPPMWFYSLETKHQQILSKLLEPVLDYYLKKN